MWDTRLRKIMQHINGQYHVRLYLIDPDNDMEIDLPSPR